VLTNLDATLTGKTHAQSEGDITSTVAARETKRGIDANGLTQKNAFGVVDKS
jgi:hypothetical protein